METLKQFTLAVLGTLGFMQLIDYPALDSELSKLMKKHIITEQSWRKT